MLKIPGEWCLQVLRESIKRKFLDEFNETFDFDSAVLVNKDGLMFSDDEWHLEVNFKCPQKTQSINNDMETCHR